tara:strand:- start:496 stop:2856 length:2361 start_codon:yes stop_codon:yes gene_type:complete
MAFVIQDYITHSKRKRKLRIDVVTTLSSYSLINNVETIPGSVVWSHEGDERNPHKRIIPMKASINFLINSQGMVDFIDDVASNPEGTFILFIYWVNKITSEEKMMFAGHFLPDPIEYQDKRNASVKIKATDGIKLMQHKRLPADIFLKNAAYNHAFYIMTILKELPWVKETIGSGEELFRTNISWHPTEFANSNGVWNEVGVNNYFFSENDQGVVEFNDFYSILFEFLECFNAHITFYNGVYAIYRLPDRAELSSVTWSLFQFSSFIFASPRAFFADLYTGTEVTNILNRDVAGPQYEFAEYPLNKFTSLIRKVVLTQTGDYYDNLLFDKTWFLGQPEDSEAVVTEIGTQDYNKRILIDIRIKAYVVIDDPSEGANGTLTCTIRAGISPSDYSINDGKWIRLSNPSNPSVNPYVNVGANSEYTIGSESVEWQTGNVNDGIKLVMECGSVFESANLTPNRRIIIEGPLIDTSGKVYIDVDNISIDDNNNPIVVELIMETTDERVVIGNSLTETSDDAGTRIITKVVNDENTRVVDLKQNMGDFPDTLINQRLLRRSGGEWLDTDEWSNGTSNDKIVNHLVEEVALMRDTAKKLVKLRMYVLDDLEPPSHLDKLTYKGKTYLPIKSSFDFYNDLWEATYFEIGVAVPGSIPGDPITTKTIHPSDPQPPGYIVPNNEPDPVGDDIVQDGENIPPLEKLNPYSNIFEEVTDDFIDLPDGVLPDPALYQSLSINDGLKIFVQGPKYTFKTSAPLRQTHFRIDKANERIYFAKSMGGRDIEVSSDPSKFKLI